MMLCVLAMRNKGLKIAESEGERRKTEATGGERKGSEKELHEHEEVTGEKPKCMKM